MTDEQNKFLHDIVNKYSKTLERYCMRCLDYDPIYIQMTQDILQTVYLEAAENVDALINHENIIGWLKITCRHIAVDCIRYKKRHAEILMPNEQIFVINDRCIQENDSPERWLDDENCKDLLQAINELLDEEGLQIFMYSVKDNHTVRETAHYLNLSEAAVRGRLFRIRKKLRNFIAVRDK